MSNESDLLSVAGLARRIAERLQPGLTTDQALAVAMAPQKCNEPGGRLLDSQPGDGRGTCLDRRTR